MSRKAEEIQAWMVERLSRLTGVAADEIDPGEPVQRYGLDSVALVAFATDLEEWLGCRFQGNPLEDHPTVESLARFLAGQSERKSE